MSISGYIIGNSAAPTSLLSSAKRPRLKSDNASDNCNDNHEQPPEDEDTPIDLAAPMVANKATPDPPPSLSNGAAPLATSSDGLSAKMRLKRQIRALAEAAAMAEAASTASETGATSGSGNAGMSIIAPCFELPFLAYVTESSIDKMKRKSLNRWVPLTAINFSTYNSPSYDVCQTQSGQRFWPCH